MRRMYSLLTAIILSGCVSTNKPPERTNPPFQKDRERNCDVEYDTVSIDKKITYIIKKESCSIEPRLDDEGKTIYARELTFKRHIDFNLDGNVDLECVENVLIIKNPENGMKDETLPITPECRNVHYPMKEVMPK